MKTVFKDLPVLDLSLRKFEKPSGAREDLVRKFCISLGLLQPGDSRDFVVNLFDLFLRACAVKHYLTSDEVYSFAEKLDRRGNAPSNVRRNLLRLKNLGLIEKRPQGYRIREWLSLHDLFEQVKSFLVTPTLDRISEYCVAIDNSLSKRESVNAHK